MPNHQPQCKNVAAEGAVTIRNRGYWAMRSSVHLGGIGGTGRRGAVRFGPLPRRPRGVGKIPVSGSGRSLYHSKSGGYPTASIPIQQGLLVLLIGRKS